MKTIEQFINEQPPERAVDFRQSLAAPGECGCAMIHYAREEIGFRGKIRAGYTSLLEYDSGIQVDVKDDMYCINMACAGLRKRPATYGELRKLL